MPPPNDRAGRAPGFVVRAEAQKAALEQPAAPRGTGLRLEQRCLYFPFSSGNLDRSKKRRLAI
jgi:hypothetical protein